MSQPYYPTLNLGALASLRTLRQQADLHEDYLDRAECPYDEDTREQLKTILAPKIIEKTVEVEVIKEVERRVEVAAKAAAGGGKRGPKPKASGVDLDEVAKEITALRDELKQLRLDGKALQTADKIQLIKLRAQLVEKMISMDERTNNLKRLSLFQSTIMGILDDLVDEDVRQEFMKRLEPFASVE